jgi:predicted methyltransferase
MRIFSKAVAAAVGVVGVFGAGVFAADGAQGHDDTHMAKAGMFDGAKLDAVLAAQPETAKARYQYRHPKETLDFFGVAPGMTVADTLPGSYYSRILLPYLGDEGTLIGVSYSEGHQAIDYGDDEKRMARIRSFPERFQTAADPWRSGSKAKVSAFMFDALPDSMKGTVDVFLLLRASHHLSKYEDAEYGQRRSKAFADIMVALKPGGVMGIVQHRAPEGNSDDWAKGFKGYVKQSALIAAAKAAGFEFVGSSEINANPKDTPTEADFVWRLPPTLAGSDEGSDLQVARKAIGESDRMTLKFRKPM